MKDKNILLFKGVAIFGVVFHHLSNRRLDPTAEEFTHSLAFAFSWCVMAFFAISGWLHAFGEDKKTKLFLQYCVSKAKRLLIPFIALILLYSIAWQVVGMIAPGAMRSSLPVTFLGKIVSSLWPVENDSVAVQLYFFPMLLGISIITHGVLKLGGPSVVAVFSIAVFLFAICYFPKCPNTGFYPGVFIWGLFSYSAAFSIFYYQKKLFISSALLLSAFVACIYWSDVSAVLKIAPLTVLLFLPLYSNTFSAPSLLTNIGEASGSIFAFHAPFVIQTMITLAAKLNSTSLQIIGCLLSAIVTILFCTYIYHSLKKTRFRYILI